MKPELEGKVAKSALVAGYVGLALLGLWKLIAPDSKQAASERSKRTEEPEQSDLLHGALRKLEGWARGASHSPSESNGHRRDPAGEPLPEEPLESLSAKTRGDAPLDNLARYAKQEFQAAEEQPRPESESHFHTSQPRSELADESAVFEVLAHQSLEQRRLRGWSEPRPAKLPVPTFAPAIMAFGIVMFAMGLATTWYVCLVGSMVFAVAAWRWVGELQEE